MYSATSNHLSYYVGKGTIVDAFHLGPHAPSSYHGIEGVVSNAFHPRPWALLTLNS
jgi:hypothetical protein